MKSVIAFAMVLLLVPACGGDGTTATTEPALADPVCMTDGAFPMEEDFIGLDETEADDLAADRSLEVRVVGEDGECFIVTDDLRQDRINLEFIDGVVVAAAIY